MGPTIVVPCQHSGPNEVLYPAAFNEWAKKFLKMLLHNLSDAKDEFILKMGLWVALQELICQLKMYARQEALFNSCPSSDTLSWWRTLSKSSDVNILAVC